MGNTSIRLEEKGGAFNRADPSNGRDTTVPSPCCRVAKIPYDDAEDGYLADAVGGAGRAGSQADRIDRARPRPRRRLSSGGFHVNINVLNRETLQDWMKHPEKHPGSRPSARPATR